jgi:hypothetical protein
MEQEEKKKKKKTLRTYLYETKGAARERVGERFLLILGREPSVCVSARYLE